MVSSQWILLCGLMTFCTGMELLCFFSFITVYTEPSAFSSVNAQSSLQVQPTEDSSVPLQCAWLNAYRPSAFSLQTPGLEFLSLTPCSSLWLEHSQGIALCCLGFDLLRVLFYLLGLLFSTHARDRKGYLVTACVCRGVSFWPWLELKHPFHSRGALALSCIIIDSSSINSPAILLVKGITTHWTDGTLTPSKRWNVFILIDESFDSTTMSWVSLGQKEKGNQSWIFIGRTDAEAEAPKLWPPDAKNWFIGKDPDAGEDWRQEDKGTAEDKMVGWHHWLNEHEFEQAPGVGDGQGSLACYSPCGGKELGMYWTEYVF